MEKILLLFDMWEKAWNNNDAQALLDLYHPDFEFHFQSNGSVMKKSDMSVELLKNIMKNEKIDHRRCIYENDEILIIHQFNEFVSGDKEALMITVLKKDDLLWRMETGVKPII